MSDDSAKEALEHLQNAALEMIRATRAFLDLAEDVVAEPGALTALGHLVGEMAAKGRAATAGAQRPEGDGPKVRRIRIS